MNLIGIPLGSIMSYCDVDPIAGAARRSISTDAEGRLLGSLSVKAKPARGQFDSHHQGGRRTVENAAKNRAWPGLVWSHPSDEGWQSLAFR
jgi:hypothetical protein